MKLGFFSAILPELSFSELLDFAAQNRFDCIEVACWPSGKAERKFAGVTHIDVTDFSQTQAEDLNGESAERGVSISALGFYPNPLDPDTAVSKKAVDHLKKVILAAEKMGLKNANTFVGRDWTKTVDENWPRFLKLWKPIISFAEDHGIKVGIENCPMSFTRDEWPGGKNLATSPVIWRRMFNDISSPNFGLNYDPSHFVLQRMDPLSPLDEFKEKLFHLHAKDMVVHQEKLNEVGIFAYPKEWHTPRIPGFGDIDWARFAARLREIGYTGAVCVEVEDGTFGKNLGGRQKALRIARNVLAPYF
ncbi:MAG TPA: sugar phosphate isomerase/epimerase [Patescibacteria group bacterium]|jgi:sugar phosphate isomerase/epimerase|nr:sugar phosphate isomerase/epimerase [Patescibacteria group bacterium]